MRAEKQRLTLTTLSGVKVTTNPEWHPGVTLLQRETRAAGSARSPKRRLA
jgi:hypothetical protein